MSSADVNIDETLAVVTARSTGVAEVVGDPAASASFVDALTDRLVEAGALHPADLRRTAPAGDRWSTAEVADMVLGPVAQLPVGDGWLVVVADAASMAPAASARLLRTIEEPPAPVWFVLCRDADDSLDVPVAGRVTNTVSLPAPTGDTRLADALELAGVRGAYDTLLADGPTGRTPMAAAETWAGSAREIAKALKPKPAGPWLRRIVRSGLDAWAAEVDQALRLTPADRAVAVAADRYARADAAARAAVGLFVPPEALLGPVVAARSEVQAAAAAATASRT